MKEEFCKDLGCGCFQYTENEIFYCLEHSPYKKSRLNLYGDQTCENCNERGIFKDCPNVSKDVMSVLSSPKQSLADFWNYDDAGVSMHVQENSFTPTRNTAGSVGYDLYANCDVTILPWHHEKITTGNYFVFPEKHYGQIFGRSGLASKFGISVLGGVIDNDYTGQVMVMLQNNSNIVYQVKRGQKIAQMVILPYIAPPIKLVDMDYINAIESARKDAGFGSSGI